MERLEFKYNDGGRSNYFKATKVGDCVVRAIAIATGKDYKEVYDWAAKTLGYSPRDGVKKKDTRKLIQSLGGKWTACMTIGSGCQHHLVANEIPMNGRIICKVSGHITAVLDGVINDTFDCSRKGKRCVYGYWEFQDLSS